MRHRVRGRQARRRRSAIELRLGRVHARRGDTATAASHLDGALDQIDGLGPSAADPRLLGAILVERSVVAVRSGDLSLAGSLANRALEVGTANRDKQAIGAALRLVGLVARASGDLEAARSALTGGALAAEDWTRVPRWRRAMPSRRGGDVCGGPRSGWRGAAICRRTGESPSRAAVENNLADQLHAAGRTRRSSTSSGP
jgi:hypothetical protein